MHIGIEAQRIFRKKKHGMDIVALELIRHLQKIDLTNKYTIFIKPGKDICLTETENFKIKLVTGLSYADWEQISLPRAAKAASIDLLHCTSNTAPLFCPVPLIVTLHDIIYLEQLNWSGSTYQNFGNLYRRLLIPALAAKKSTTFITVSDFERTRIMDKLRLNSLRISVVYNGVGESFRSSNTSNRDLDLPKAYILFLGNKAPKKNFGNVIRAYIRYRKITKDVGLPLVIPESNHQLIKSILLDEDGQRYNDDIVSLPYIANNELSFVYKNASLFLYPSLRESFGIPIIESMASGTPVITSNTSSMPEVAGGAAYLVDPTSVNTIAKAIETVLTTPSLQAELIRKGYDRANNFSWGKSATKVLDIYNKALILA